MFTYKGYIGKIDYEEGMDLFHGEVINTRDVIPLQCAIEVVNYKAIPFGGTRFHKARPYPLNPVQD